MPRKPLSDDVIIPQGKMIRLMRIIEVLTHHKLSIAEIMDILDVAERTAYRYLHLIKFMGVPVKTKGRGKYRYWYVDCCPFCKKPLKEVAKVKA